MTTRWGFMFDSDWLRRQDIDSVTHATEGMADNMANLGSQVTRLRAQVQHLSATVSVMMKMLAESSSLDTTVLKYRVEAELDAQADAQANPAAQTIKCGSCGSVVAIARSTMTADGPICDGCAATVR